jgi:hypothetical protein
VTERRIYYGDGTVAVVRTREAYAAAPDHGVQVMAEMRPYPDGRRPWRGVDDRMLWTGEDVYDPFGWGAKLGSLIPDAEYFAIWERACGDA